MRGVNIRPTYGIVKKNGIFTFYLPRIRSFDWDSIVFENRIAIIRLRSIAFDCDFRLKLFDWHRLEMIIFHHKFMKKSPIFFKFSQELYIYYTML